jgi:hypothetical protein
MEQIIYKGITITIENGYYKFILNGIQYSNTNIHMAKRMITRDLK